MSAFKPKRISGEEMQALIGPVTRHLPSASASESPVAAGAAAPPRAPRKVQVNFEASLEFADLIAEEAARAGSTRRFFARLCRDAGYLVPETDVNPPDNRRRRGLGRAQG